MSRIYFHILLIVSISVSCAEREKVVNVEYHEPTYEIEYFKIDTVEVIDVDGNINFDRKTGYLMYKKRRFSGRLLQFYNNGQVKSTIGYYNGLKEDTSFGYHQNGELEYKRTYHEGKKHGLHQGWFENGQKEFEYYFYLGKSEGVHSSWYKSGAQQKVKHYQHGKQFGPQKTWYENGKIFTNYVVKEDGRKYGLFSIKRCIKVDSKNETE